MLFLPKSPMVNILVNFKIVILKVQFFETLQTNTYESKKGDQEFLMKYF